MLEIEKVLRNNSYIRHDSIAFWFTKFYEDCCGEEDEAYCIGL